MGGGDLNIQKKVKNFSNAPKINFLMAEIARRVRVGSSAIVMSIRRKNS